MINNVDVTVAMDAEQIKAALVRQLYSPVRWRNRWNGRRWHWAIGWSWAGKVLAGLASVLIAPKRKSANEPTAIAALTE